MVAKKFRLPYTAVILLPLRLQKIDCAIRAFNKFTVLRGIGVARIFDWGGPKLQITCNDVIKNFQKKNFLWGKDIVEWKIRSCSLSALYQDFGKGRGRKLIVRKCKRVT